MGRMVNTVCGPVPANELGSTLAHEHLVYGYPGYQGDSVNVDGRAGLIDSLVTRLSNMKVLGLRTFVDATPNDCGRDVTMMKEVSERAGINIIACTGYYFEGEGATNYLKFYQSMTGDAYPLVFDVMNTELYKGVAGTDIKAGVIKLATGLSEISPYEEKFFRAAAEIASKDPDIRIITHTQLGTLGLAQAKYLTDAGVKPNQIAIGHICCCTDIDELMKILELGCYLQFDRWGLEEIAGSPMDTRRIALTCGLTAAGYGNRIMFSHDHPHKYLGAAMEYSPAVKKGTVNWRWEHIYENVLDDLHKAGLTQGQVQAFMVDNPQAFYG